MERVVLGTSVQGAAHIRSGAECQDSHKKKTCENGTVIMSIADGHGSKNCPFSKIGADIAVDVFCETMTEYIENFSETSDMLLTYLNREGDTSFAQLIEVAWKERVYDDYRQNRCDMPDGEKSELERQSIYDQYGTTLLGTMIAENYIFAFQIGDGNIAYISDDGYLPVIVADRILGVETHSLCKEEAWKKAITAVRRIEFREKIPAMLMMSTDGFANSYSNEDEFTKTCIEYFNAINNYGYKSVGENLERWLSETSALGCGDDITVMMAYIASDSETFSGSSDETAAVLNPSPLDFLNDAVLVQAETASSDESEANTNE